MGIEIRRAAIWALSQVGGPLASDALRQLAESPGNDEPELIDRAIDNLAFESGARELLLLDFDLIKNQIRYYLHEAYLTNNKFFSLMIMYLQNYQYLDMQ